MVVQVDPSGEVWIWNALPYAFSQFRTTWQIDWVEPRSTSSHCGSENALDQRVPRLPSTASWAGKPAFSREEAVAVLFSARFVVPQVPPPPAVTVQLKVPAVVGVPEIRPEEELMDSPAGRPTAL